MLTFKPRRPVCEHFRVFEISGESSIACAEYSASEVTNKLTPGADYYNVSTTRPIEYNNLKQFNNLRHPKNRKINKMGPRGSKIDHNGTIRTVFDLKITFPTCACVKNITFDQCFKIFTFFIYFF